MSLPTVINGSFYDYFIFFSNTVTRKIPPNLEREMRPNAEFILATACLAVN